jgi:hypothetical protein
MTESISQQISGAGSSIEWFGYWPDFHDGKILELHLNPRGSSRIIIYTWNLTDKIDSNGYLIREKHAVVTFFFDELSEVELSFNDFGQQHEISELSISRCGNELRLTIWESNGGLRSFIQGTISRVELSPGEIEVKSKD